MALTYLQYVKPTGNRQTYSDTDLYINDMEFRFEFEYLYYTQPSMGGSGDWSELLGTGYPNRLRVGSQSANNIFMSYGGTQYNAGVSVIEGAVSIDKYGMKVDGTDVITISSPASSIGSRVLCIGACSQYHGDALVNPDIKIGRLKVYHNNVLVADYVPADNGGIIGFYDEVSGNFYSSQGSQPWVAGPAASSISVSVDTTYFKASGGSKTVSITCQNDWTASTPSFVTLSASSGSGDGTITVTAPSYTGTTGRTDTITFTDTTTGDEAEITFTQKKYSAGQPVYLGSSECTEIYLGASAVSEAYLGTVLVYSSGPFQGLKMKPSLLYFTPTTLSNDVTVKSSENWTLTAPSWITASTLTGGTGETTVTLTTTAQTAATSGTVVVTTANYSAETTCSYNDYIRVPYIHSTLMRNEANQYLYTSIYPTHTLSGNVKGQFKRYHQAGVYIGTANNDSQDWRLFILNSGSSWYMDVANGRVNGNIGVSTAGQDFDIDFGNLYIKNVLDDITRSGSTQSGNIEVFPIKIDLGITWISEVKLIDNGVLIFDGVAAQYAGEYGLWDTVNSTFLTDPSLNIVAEL